MQREVNETIGAVKCPFTGELAEVRKTKRGVLYMVGAAGNVTPNLEPGQDYILNNMIAFTDEQREQVNAQPPRFGRRDLSIIDLTKKTPETKPEPVKTSLVDEIL